MDSISQIALGAAVGVAVMGRRTAPWKAALWGAVCGTLPDLDVLIRYGDPISDMTRHRAHSHAPFWQTLASLPLAWIPAWLDRRNMPARQSYRGWLLLVWLALVTHALLDAMTVYGTQIALPFTDQPVGLGSVFIIDPLYTLPLLVALWPAVRLRGVAATQRQPRLRAWRMSLAGLAVSSAYLAWGVVAQQLVLDRVRSQLASMPSVGAPPVERILVTPAPFNTVLWRVLIMRSDRYEEGFYSLLDDARPIRFASWRIDPSLFEQARDIAAVRRIAWFSRGFFRLDEKDGSVRITDLRMGQEPFYVFSFEVARRASPLQAVTPRAVGGRSGLDLGASLRWLMRRTLGEDIDPPVQQQAGAPRRPPVPGQR